MRIIAIDKLCCESLAEPLNIDDPAPRLSWRMEAARRGVRQSAYQILVASAPELLARDTGDLWDSGKVIDDKSVLIPYAGKALKPRTRYFWKVRVWDEADAVSSWSAPASWTTGMMGQPWPGNYIALDRSTGDPEHPLLRKSFVLSRKPCVARAYINALGYYELHINGNKVDDYLLTPGPSQFDKRSLYVVHDVTEILRAGENVCGLWLGRGWYLPTYPGVAHDGPVVRGFLELLYPDGTTEQLVTDASWKGHASHYARLGSGRCGNYGGEKADGRHIIPGWSKSGYDDALWTPVALPDIPDHEVAAMLCEPNRVVYTFHPHLIRPFDGEDAWLVDFGRNLTGLFSMRFDSLAPGQEVQFEFADHIEDDGSLKTLTQCDTYIARGENGEFFENRFNYHAFRYVRIQGLDCPPDRQSMTARLVRTGYPVQSGFASSNPLLNNIHDMIHYTLECLTLGGYMVDCPHAERMGYGGDGLSSTPAAMTMHGMGPLYANWLAHWRDCQRPDGGLPHTAPCFNKRGGGPYWCAFVIGAPWQAYLHYGDRRMLDENYPMMQRWLDGYVGAHRESNGLLLGWPEVDYRNWYLGDWARPGRTELQAEQSVHLVTNCMLAQCLGQMRLISQLLEKNKDAARYADEHKDLLKQIHTVFFDPEKTTYADDTQLDLAYPLMVGAVPENLRSLIIQRLEDKIMVEHAGHLDVGLVGVPILTQTLELLGRDDLVFAYTAKKTFPGWGYMLAEGGTTTWEHWDGKRSHIHNCYNGIGEWFYAGIAGIRPKESAPGYKEFILRPTPVDDLTWAHARKETSYGLIESYWRIDENRVFHWRIRIPPNTSADVCLPAKSAADIKESDQPLHTVLADARITAESDRIVLRLGAGSYCFTVAADDA
ncbi:MAG: glycoside hydrolase family 78 protein [Lentisphaerae bacterium]|nr:glycoside hydrolase family 78 protein [Lentisphaerota bacterium]